MEMVVNMKESPKEKFWKEWLEADLLKRLKLIENLAIIKEVEIIHKLPKKYRKESIAQSLNGLFEDLEEELYLRLEKSNNVKKK